MATWFYTKVPKTQMREKTVYLTNDCPNVEKSD